MKPIGLRILVKPPAEPKGDVTSGGIILPVNIMAKAQYDWGEVVVVGVRVTEVKAGDFVLFDRYSDKSHRVTIDGTLHFLIEQPNILAKQT